MSSTLFIKAGLEKKKPNSSRTGTDHFYIRLESPQRRYRRSIEES